MLTNYFLINNQFYFISMTCKLGYLEFMEIILGRQIDFKIIEIWKNLRKKRHFIIV